MTLSTAVLQSVEPRQLASWLHANGWSLVDTRPQHTATYEKRAPDGEAFVVDVPLNVAFRDYARRIAEIFDTLVVASAKPANWLLEEVRASTSDIIRFRAAGPSIGQGRVPVDLGIRMFECARDLLLAAACSAHDPRPVYRTRRPRPVDHFLGRVKLVAPEEGSFVIVVHAPIPPDLERGSGMEALPVPFERMSTLVLARAIGAARVAAEYANLVGEADPFLGGTAVGISANLCEALAEFVDGEGTTGLDVQFAWARSRAVPDGTPTSVRVDSDISPALRQAALLLRAHDATPDFELEGAVVELDGQTLYAAGVATLAGRVDGVIRKVRVPMDAGDYWIARRAYEERQFLRCEGELVRRGERFQLERVRHVALVIPAE